MHSNPNNFLENQANSTTKGENLHTLPASLHLTKSTFVIATIAKSKLGLRWIGLRIGSLIDQNLFFPQIIRSISRKIKGNFGFFFNREKRRELGFRMGVRFFQLRHIYSKLKKGGWLIPSDLDAILIVRSIFCFRIISRNIFCNRKARMDVSDPLLRNIIDGQDLKFSSERIKLFVCC